VFVGVRLASLAHRRQALVACTTKRAQIMRVKLVFVTFYPPLIHLILASTSSMWAITFILGLALMAMQSAYAVPSTEVLERRGQSESCSDVTRAKLHWSKTIFPYISVSV